MSRIEGSLSGQSSSAHFHCSYQASEQILTGILRTSALMPLKLEVELLRQETREYDFERAED